MSGWGGTLQKQDTVPRKQTCILHLTRSRGTTAVCVVPQLRIPPKPHMMKYFCEPNSQLSPSEETQGRLRKEETFSSDANAQEFKEYNWLDVGQSKSCTVRETSALTFTHLVDAFIQSIHTLVDGSQ